MHKSQEKKIYIQFQGGIGNQLFQYCAGLAIQNKIGGIILLLPTRLNKDYRSTVFQQDISVSEITNSLDLFTFSRLFEGWSVSELKDKTSIVLDGYFQCFPPLVDVLPLVVKNVLEFLKTKIYEMSYKYSITAPEKTTFVHIRRGDYVGLEHLFGGVGEKYYTNAINAINLRNENIRRVLVISNDPVWCSSQLWLNKYQVITEDDEFNTLAIMALCKGGAIIANSTFSWWGANLSQTMDVFYPSKWYCNEKVNMFPESWTCVEC